jgi:hypothetical protein
MGALDVTNDVMGQTLPRDLTGGAVEKPLKADVARRL